MRLENLDFVQDFELGNPLLGYGFGAKVSCNGTHFEIAILVVEGRLVATYRKITSDMLTYFNRTNFTVNVTGDIIDLLDDNTRITKICSVVPAEPQDINLQFKNMTLPVHVYPGGGVEVRFPPEHKTNNFN